METWERPDGVLMQVHNRGQCDPELHCLVHNPLHTHMDSWPMLWRSDRGIMERTCPHGIGHPDPSQFDYWYINDREAEAVHGCDGCCKTSK